MRLVFAFTSGSVFGIGLLLAGMTDTRRVQGWLDFFGNWDPTLAFVMGGAIISMAIAWWWSKGSVPLLGGDFPQRPDPGIDRNLVLGSILFGIGWGLSGLCPGPSLASLSFGGSGGLIFMGAMIAGMLAAPSLSSRLSGMIALQ